MAVTGFAVFGTFLLFAVLGLLMMRLLMLLPLVLLPLEILNVAARFDHLDDLVDLVHKSLCANVDAVVCKLGLVRLCTVLVSLGKK